MTIAMTAAALKQLAKMEAKKIALNNELADFEKGFENKPRPDYYFRERNRIYAKMQRNDDSIHCLNERKMTAAEEKKVFAEADRHSYRKTIDGEFVVTEKDSSLGCRGTTVVGFSTVLQHYVMLRWNRYNGFMNNVKGCSGMVGKTSYSAIRLITREEYEQRCEMPWMSQSFGPAKEVARQA